MNERRIPRRRDAFEPSLLARHVPPSTCFASDRPNRKVRGGSRCDADELPAIFPSDIQELFQQQNLIAGLHAELPNHVFPTHTVSLSKCGAPQSLPLLAGGVRGGSLPDHAFRPHGSRCSPVTYLLRVAIVPRLRAMFLAMFSAINLEIRLGFVWLYGISPAPAATPSTWARLGSFGTLINTDE